jgi:peptide/nickel transport system permease protein
MDDRVNPFLKVGLALVMVLAAIAVLAPWISPYDAVAPVADSFGEPWAPSLQHLCGTDELGRDVLSRLIFGARVSLLVAVVATVLTLVIGVSVGAVAGYAGGAVDTALMRATDVVLAFPGILLAIALAAVLRPGLTSLFTVIALVSWTGVARSVRSEILSLRERDFVLASRALGATDWRVVSRHLIPNAIPTILTLAALSTCGTLLLDAGLSFLGLGVPVPTPSWGRMLSDSQSYYRVAPWLMIFPGLAIVTAVLSFNLLGYGLLRLAEHKQDR